MRTLLSPPPGSQVSGSRSAAVCRAAASRTVPASKGSLRRAQNRRALAFCAPFCRLIPRDGRLRRPPSPRTACCSRLNSSSPVMGDKP